MKLEEDMKKKSINLNLKLFNLNLNLFTLEDQLKIILKCVNIKKRRYESF